MRNETPLPRFKQKQFGSSPHRIDEISSDFLGFYTKKNAASAEAAFFRVNI